MDFTLSPQYVVHPATGQRMHDQNQSIPTQVSDKDLNSLMWSMMAVLNDAGVAGMQFDPANPDSYQRFLVALKALFLTRTDLLASEIGKISFVPASTPSPGHMPVFGTEVSRGGAYADLWDYAQTYGVIVDEATHATRPGAFSYGPGGVGGSTFRVPKINGLVIKAYHNGDGTYTTDVSSLIGQYIPDQVLTHSHGIFTRDQETGTGAITVGGGVGAGTYQTDPFGGAENLVRSVILYPQIRYML